MSQSKKRGPSDKLLGFLKKPRYSTPQTAHSAPQPSTPATALNTPHLSGISPSGPQSQSSGHFYDSVLPQIGDEEWGERGFAAFKEVVGIVKEVSDWMPVLKSAAAGLLVVLERIEVCLSLVVPTILSLKTIIQRVRGAPSEFRDVVSTLDRFAGIIKAHRSAPGESSEGRKWLDDRIVEISKYFYVLYRSHITTNDVRRFSRAIETQTQNIAALLTRGILRRIVEASADVQRVAQILRAIEYLVYQFLVSRSSFMVVIILISHALQLDVSMRTNVVVENINRVRALAAISLNAYR